MDAQRALHDPSLLMHLPVLAALLAVFLIGLAGCHRVLESESLTFTLAAPADAGCVQRGLEQAFGAASVRPVSGGARFVLADFPLEGYVRTVDSGAGLAVTVEIDRVARYRGAAPGPLATRLATARQALESACGR